MDFRNWPTRTVDKRTFLKFSSLILAAASAPRVFAQSYQAPGVYIQELDGPVRKIEAADTSVGLFLDRFSNDLEEGIPHECFSEADLYRFVGREGSLLFPVAYAAARNFFVHGGHRLFIINTPMAEETPDWSSVTDNTASFPDASLVYLPTAAVELGADRTGLGALCLLYTSPSPRDS